jgi:phosphate transport system permease protein
VLTSPSSLATARNRMFESALGWLLFFCAAISVMTTIAVLIILTTETFRFFQSVSPFEFLFGTEWSPLIAPKHYGVLPLISGTLLVVIGASLVAVPLGLASAIYLSEYASPRMRQVIKPTLEILAGIPTVVFGYFALITVTPLLRQLFPELPLFNAASAAIVVGIMILPMVASLCDDALRAVPDSLRHAAYSLGATPFEVTGRVVLPAALSGVFASFVLAISRAIGETMIVTLAAGATPNLTFSPLESIQTMTAYIVELSLGDVPTGDLTYQTLFAVVSILFLITFFLNFIGQRIMLRMREVYQ